jgi:serine/threonine protein kinase
MLRSGLSSGPLKVLSMAKVIAIGQPVNEAERQAIAHLRDRLPDTYTILHNFEITRDGDKWEIDIAVVAPHAVYLADVKGTHGVIDVYGPKWYPEGRSPYPSPLAKLRGHARTLKGIITESQPTRQDLKRIYVDAAVVLTAPDAHLNDRDGRDDVNVTTLRRSAPFFQNSARIPGQYSKSIAALHAMVIRAIQGVARPRSGPLRFGNWEVQERLGGTDDYIEYRVFNVYAGARAGAALLRAYKADPYAPAEERAARKNLIATAYRALNHLPGHPNIVGVRDFFETEEGDRFILVTEDVSGQALRSHMERPALALTFDQKYRIARELLDALAHAHSHAVVHRNLNPANLMVGVDGQLHLIGFDFARIGTGGSYTIAHEIVDEIETAYCAPEAFREPGRATAASDVFSAGLVVYELFTGEKPFSGDPTVVFDQSGVFPVKPSAAFGEAPAGFDDWLQSLCAFDADKRPTAREAEQVLKDLLSPRNERTEDSAAADPAESVATSDVDYANLTTGFQLTAKFVVERRLGRPGSFGVVYKVIDTLGDVARAIKLVLHDRHSTLDRLKREYQQLVRIPDHPHVVRVLDADVIPGGGPPFILFEFIEGSDVGEMIEQHTLAPEDTLDLARQVVEGLCHLHHHGVFHLDIKPRNLLWTPRGAKIIDFNVSVRASDSEGRGGGSRRYLPPDFDPSVIPQNGERADRDLYALGLTIYEALTGRYPWDTAVPPVGVPAPDPRELSGFADLASEFTEVVLTAIAPTRAQRFSSAVALRDTLNKIRTARRILPVRQEHAVVLAGAGSNRNPYVSHLITLFSQSRRSNAGTRGLDELGVQSYVDTALDRELVPAVLAGEFRLVLISGNAGDGKTAFLQKLEKQAEANGATLDRSLPNGCRFTLRGLTCLLNYDGSQDEGDKSNDEVLRQFFKPFAGSIEPSKRARETRLIAINEGRLVDFLAAHATQFRALRTLVMRSLRTGEPSDGIAVINLNLRSVVADAPGGSILERQLTRMTEPRFWAACENCDLKSSCYALHNARTFQDETAGPKVTERLKTLFTMSHLRGRLHITMRDLRSALAYTLVSNRDCDEIHALYAQGKREEIAGAYYFNSWMGNGLPTADRLLGLLADVDIGLAEDPRFDRSLDFLSPDDRGLFRFEQRSGFDRDVMRGLFESLPRDFSGTPNARRNAEHRSYIAMARRRNFFERRDNGWRSMLSYRTADRLVNIVRDRDVPEKLRAMLLNAINRGEGLLRPERLAGSLALQVRHVEGGTVRSYRLFPLDRFTLNVKDEAERARFVEHLPTGLVLRFAHEAEGVEPAELLINLDMFEMLERLNEGYRPSIEEMQGYYLSLAVFKNALNAAPYKEIMLTTSGHDFYRLERHTDGMLEMTRIREVT